MSRAIFHWIWQLAKVLPCAVVVFFAGCDQKLTSDSSNQEKIVPSVAIEPTKEVKIEDLPTVKGWTKETYTEDEDMHMVNYNHKDSRTSAMIYIYSREAPISDGPDSPEIENEYELAASAIEEFGVYSTAKRMKDQNIPWGKGREMKRVRYVTVMNLGAMVSDTMITARGGKVVKIRLTRSWPLDADEEKVIDEFLHELSQVI